MYNIGPHSFPTFHELVVWANAKGYLFDPDKPLIEGDYEKACRELEAYMVEDNLI